MMQGLEDVEFFEDVCSGSVALGQRPGGKVLLTKLQPDDNVIVLKLDRVFRNATDALIQADAFKAMGVNLYLIDMGTDPVTQNGTSRMFFGMLALMAEFERERIRERTADGQFCPAGAAESPAVSHLAYCSRGSGACRRAAIGPCMPSRRPSALIKLVS